MPKAKNTAAHPEADANLLIDIFYVIVPGLCSSPSCHIVHEWTYKTAKSALEDVRPRSCQDCVEGLAEIARTK